MHTLVVQPAIPNPRGLCNVVHIAYLPWGQGRNSEFLSKQTFLLYKYVDDSLFLLPMASAGKLRMNRVVNLLVVVSNKLTP